MRRFHLTPREQQVATMISCAHTNKEIAKELGTTVGAVKIALTRLFQKVQVRNRVELATWFRDNYGLVGPSVKCSECLLRIAHLMGEQ
jgi:DNA-binding NarL/FixJ family response regulator